MTQLHQLFYKLRELMNFQVHSLVFTLEIQELHHPDRQLCLVNTLS